MLLKIQDQARLYCLVGETHSHTKKELRAVKDKYEKHKNPTEDKLSKLKLKCTSMEHQIFIIDQKIS